MIPATDNESHKLFLELKEMTDEQFIAWAKQREDYTDIEKEAVNQLAQYKYKKQYKEEQKKLKESFERTQYKKRHNKHLMKKFGKMFTGK